MILILPCPSKVLMIGRDSPNVKRVRRWHGSSRVDFMFLIPDRVKITPLGISVNWNMLSANALSLQHLIIQWAINLKVRSSYWREFKWSTHSGNVYLHQGTSFHRTNTDFPITSCMTEAIPEKLKILFTVIYI